MTDGTFRLSPWQVAVLVFILSLCTTALSFPGPIDRQLGRHGWMAALPGIAVGLWGTLVAWDLPRRFPGGSFDRTVVQLLGPWLGVPYLLALLLLFAGGAATNLAAFGLASTATQLTRLPLAYPVVLTAAVGILAAYYGPEVVARTAEVFAPVMGAGLLAIFLPLAAEGQIGRLLPLGGLTWRQVWSGDVLAAAGLIRGFLPLLVLGPWCRPTARVLPLCAATAAAGILVAGSFGVPVMLFGAAFTARLRQPFLVATGTLAWQWLPVHNLRVLTMMVWHADALIVFALYLWLGAWLLKRLWPALPWPAAVIGLGATACAGASLQMPSDVFHAVFLLWNDAVLVLGVLPPTLLWVLARRYSPVTVPGRRVRL